jgi:hypothetical protein
MAVTFTVTDVNSSGNLKVVHGTFTSADGDTTGTLNAAVHGLNYIVDYNITLDTGAVGVQNPKVTVSSGTITAVWDDTQGLSGKFYVKGR